MHAGPGSTIACTRERAVGETYPNASTAEDYVALKVCATPVGRTSVSYESRRGNTNAIGPTELWLGNYGVIPINLRRELEQLHEGGLAWARYCCRQQNEEAEDLLHEVYLRVLDGRARFDGQSSFKTWLFAVIRRTTRERARIRWLHLNLLDRWSRAEADPNREPEHAQRLQESERARRFRSALLRLARRQQEILHLVFYQDFTVEESAKMLGISVGSARTHFARGKQRLRELLQTENGDAR